MPHDYDTTVETVQELIDKARQHGEDEDTDHEVGDLQSMLRELWLQADDLTRRLFLDSLTMDELKGVWDDT